MMIHEIFRSVQGEGTFMGVNAVFVRVFGCNLTCPFCDSKETWRSGAGTRSMKIEEIAAEIENLDPMGDCQVVITGGEPTIYGNLISDLCTAIESGGRQRFISIETNGTLPVPEGIDFITCSPKAQNKYRIACRLDELKLVVDDNLNEDVIREIVYNHSCPIYLQPESCKPESVQKALDLMKIFPTCRLGIQAHKYWDLL